jgi:hypothetical protein
VIAGAYTMHLYCDEPGCTATHGRHPGFVEISAHTLRECIKEAKQKGWRLDLTERIALCPEHSKKRKATP